MARKIEVQGSHMLEPRSAPVSTHRTQRPYPSGLATPAAPARSLEPEGVASLRKCATVVQARRRQQIAFNPGASEAVFIVRSGMLVLQTEAPGKQRQLLSILYPGDICRAALAPPLPALALMTVTPAELWRMPAATFDTQLEEQPVIGRQLNAQLADQHARAVLHVAMIGALNGEERVAAFLIELALRMGTPSGNGISFEFPLSRTDVADYLSLNADTLSRIMSRLKGRGLVAQAARDRAVIPDFEAFCDLTAVTDTLKAVHGQGAAKPKRS